MWLSNLSIRQPVLITMVMLALVVTGLLAYGRMSVDFYPDVAFPTVSIVTIYPGAGPADVDAEISEKIEEAMMTLSGVEDVRSQSGEGLSVVLVTFNLERDAVQASQDVREKMASIRSQLPEDAFEPTIARFDPASLPIMSIAVAGRDQTTAGDIRQIAEKEILPRLQRVEGVADVSVEGGREREIQVLLDVAALKARRVTPQQVVQTIMAESLSIPGGSIEQQGQNLLLRTPGNFERIEDVARLQVATPTGPVKIGDLATVQDGVKTPVKYNRLDQQDAVVISIRKQTDGNTIRVAAGVHAELETLQRERPDLVLTVIRDQSTFIEESFNDAIRELIIGALMASVVVWLFFRDLRNTLVTVAGLPVIMIGTFGVMNALGLGFNVISLLGLSLSVGLVIDDAIVVRENIFRHMERGATPREAASRGTAEVALAVLAMTLTVVSVFLPVTFTTGLVGRFFRPFGIVVASAVLISLFEAFTLAPMLSAYFFKQREITGELPDEADPLAGSQGLLGALDRLYHRLLGWTLRHRWTTIAAGVVIVAVSLYAATFLKVAFIPPADTGTLTIALALPPGTALSETDALALQVEARLLDQAEVEAVLASVGGQGSPENASFFVRLKPGNPVAAFTTKMRAGLADLPGLSILEGGLGWGNTKPVEITLRTVGSTDELNQFSLVLADRLRQVPGLVEVETSYKPGKPEVQFVVDRQRAADLGVSVATVGATIRTLVEGATAATYRGAGPEADIRVQLRPEDRDGLPQLLDLPIPTPRGLVPLRQVARIQMATGPTQLTRLNGLSSVVIEANTAGRAESDAVADARAVLAATTFPTGVTYSFTGMQQSQQEAFQSLGVTMLLSVVFVYMVLASQFASFIQPLVIMLALPLAIIGALLALLVTGQALGLVPMIGFIMLMGLVAKNSILLIDLTNHLRQERDLSIAEALLIAGPRRLRPILMTTLALILGMIPVAIGLGAGSDLRQSMAIAIIGGLVTSTLLTLALVPAAYSLVEGGLARLQRRRAASTPRQAEATQAAEPV